MRGPYHIHVAPTGFGRQRRIIVMKDTICGRAKWDDVTTPSAACAARTLRRMRSEYGVKRAFHWPTPDKLAAMIWADDEP